MTRIRAAGHLLGIGLLGIVVAASLMPVTELPPNKFSDKALHVLTFIALGFWYGLLWPTRLRAVLLGGLAFGGLIEVLQALTDYRSAEWLDWLADGLGLVLALAVLKALLHLRTHANPA